MNTNSNLPVRKDAAFPLTFQRRQWFYILDNKEFTPLEATCHLLTSGFDPVEGSQYKALLRSDYERLNPRR